MPSTSKIVRLGERTIHQTVRADLNCGHYLFVREAIVGDEQSCLDCTLQTANTTTDAVVHVRKYIADDTYLWEVDDAGKKVYWLGGMSKDLATLVAALLNSGAIVLPERKG